jgi:hypothetical protein
MATLHEYFIQDAAKGFTIAQETWTLGDTQGGKLGEVIARLHYNFNAQEKYVSFYINATKNVSNLEVTILNKVQELLWPKYKTGLRSGWTTEDMKNAKELMFTDQIYIYSEHPVPKETMDRLITESEAFGHTLIFRSSDYMNERNKPQGLDAPGS